MKLRQSKKEVLERIIELITNTGPFKCDYLEKIRMGPHQLLEKFYINSADSYEYDKHSKLVEIYSISYKHLNKDVLDEILELAEKNTKKQKALLLLGRTKTN